MGSRPAATIEGSVKLGAIHRRLFDFLDRMPAHSHDLLATSLLPAGLDTPPPQPQSTAQCRNDFYWLLFPEWMAPEGGEALDDVLWAQYCIYGLLRIQDDVIDGDAPDPHLAVAGNHLALESGRVLRRHFDSESEIWAWYGTAMAQTSDALVAIDRRQGRSQRQGENDLQLFAHLSRCLTVAMRAAVLLVTPEDHWRRWLQVLDHLAIAGQILDDFHDLKGDLARGSLNYAAWFLTHPVFSPHVEATEAVIASNLATSDRLSHLFDQVRRHLDGAAGLLRAADDPRHAAYVARFHRTVDRLEFTVAERHGKLFGGAAAPTRAVVASYTAT